MSAIVGFVSSVFWGVIVLSVLVFIHEAGHYLAARAFGVRVTEFMLGLPCRYNFSFKSRKVGTRFGVTPLLLGGYNRISGMEPIDEDVAAKVLHCVQRHGRVESAKIAEELGIDEEVALSALASLSEWASVRPFYNPELGEEPNQKTYPAAFETVARDAALLTEFDQGHDFSAAGATKAGEARDPGCTAEEFLIKERAHTYLGLGFLRRLAVLLAGPLVNVAFAFIVVTAGFMATGIPVASNEPVIGSVVEGSYAQASGIEAGDKVVKVGDVDVSTWDELSAAMSPYLADGVDFQLTVNRGDAELYLTVDLPDGETSDRIGITSQTAVYRPNPVQAAGLTLRYAQMVGSFVVKLVVPHTTMEVLNQSTSVVGISVMASEAASSGPADLVMLAASISMSLGFMNLLPIPPLDGGKILIEAIQAVTKKKLSAKVQNYLSYVGLAFFLFVFVVVLKNDIFRFVIG